MVVSVNGPTDVCAKQKRLLASMDYEDPMLARNALIYWSESGRVHLNYFSVPIRLNPIAQEGVSFCGNSCTEHSGAQPEQNLVLASPGGPIMLMLWTKSHTLLHRNQVQFSRILGSS